MKNLAISLLVVGAVFGNLAYSADGQIERLKIELEKRVTIMNEWKKTRNDMSVLLSRKLSEDRCCTFFMKILLVVAPIAEKKAENEIDSLKREIKELSDLKSEEGEVFGSTVCSIDDQVEPLKIALAKKVEDLDKFSQRIDKFNEEFEIVVDRLASKTSESFVHHALQRAWEINTIKKKKMEAEIDSIKRKIAEIK